MSKHCDDNVISMNANREIEVLEDLWGEDSEKTVTGGKVRATTKDLLDKFSLLQNSELVESQSNENFLHIEKALSKENYLNSFREIVKW